MDCGPSCLQMISKYHGKELSLQRIRDLSYLTRQGVSMLGLSDAAESLGFHCIGARLGLEQLKEEAPLPCIVHWKQNHFIVVYKIKKHKIFIADPAFGLNELSEEEFSKGWISTTIEGSPQGHCLLLNTTPEFYLMDEDTEKKKGFRLLISYLFSYKKLIIQLGIGFLFGSLLQLLFPLLTQSMVDIGINNQDIKFVYLILLAQLFLFLSRVSVDFIRGWILLHIGARINISLVADFLSRFMQLPLSFFNTKLRGDYLQRVADQKRIENFLASGSISVLFSLVNVFIFAIILGVYSLKIFLIFLFGSSLYVIWISLFLKRRRALDHQLFEGWSKNQNILVEIFEGMEDVKLNNSEKHKRWEWERIQASLFRLKMKNLKLEQYQQAGAVFINEGNNILITFMAATAVIHGQMTLGMMLAVSYILGQLNSPLNQLIVFMQLAQDAKISLERINDIEKTATENEIAGASTEEMPVLGGIEIKNLSFQYEGPHSPWVLNEISLDIPDKKVTAIVGMSGSGKTTLIKLMLGFYFPVKGDIRVGGVLLNRIHPKAWRNRCGAVMQDGYIFSDSLARNIAMGDENIDMNKILEVAQIAQLNEFVDSLPMGYNTKIGANGQGLSQGQKQRILIARALYKDPAFLFFDEATNALDAKNEKLILENLEQYFAGKTVVVVAHRLSTVRNAHKIVVLDKGLICETGTHDELIKRNGIYFRLIKDQLELGL